MTLDAARARYKNTQMLIEIINNCFNISITAKPFDCGLRKGMRKAAHPSGGVGSSNLHRWRG